MSNIVNTVWIGKQLGPVHAACLRSFLRNGYDVVLHSFGMPEDAPVGVRLFDASKLMALQEVDVFRKAKMLALASDIYRYRIQREGMGLYADCDVYCLKPLDEDDYIFGWESSKLIGSAVLKIPPQSRLLQELLEAAEDLHFIPPWLPRRKRNKMGLRKKLGFPVHVADQAWGVIGPQLLTHHVREMNLTNHASSIDAFYNLHFECTGLLYEPGLSVRDLATSRSSFLHLCNSRLKPSGVPAGSPMHEILNA
ncbi:galactosyltransferase Lgt5 [Ensifer sp. ZNC0028]|uniref:galactosyltransferase Lgt5 n=1 Tax=Ensifer sp. ZNC0028 TaxID=1339236 RepID=UPI0012E052DD|nr:galactosyltransferase Lgt5 [Ensifer sp. ZNC0028]